MSMSGISAVIFISFNTVLFAAAVMDMMTKKVYDFLWMIAVLLSLGLLFTKPEVGIAETAGLVIYVAVQEFVMARVYGRADSHALCVCAMFLILSGKTAEVCIFHFAVSFLLLTVIQSALKNVDSRGKLKKKVAMVPYITVGLWITSAVFM